MGTEDLQRKSLKRRLSSCVAAIALIGNTMAPVSTAVAAQSQTQTPIKHVIIIIGENRSFDHVFATYKPVNKGEKVLNLLSEGIVKADGTPGPNYGDALQYQAYDYDTFQSDAAQDALRRSAARARSAARRTPYVCVGLNWSPPAPPASRLRISAAAKRSKTASPTTITNIF